MIYPFVNRRIPSDFGNEARRELFQEQKDFAFFPIYGRQVRMLANLLNSSSIGLGHLLNLLGSRRTTACILVLCARWCWLWPKRWVAPKGASKKIGRSNKPNAKGHTLPALW